MGEGFLGDGPAVVVGPPTDQRIQKANHVDLLRLFVSFNPIPDFRQNRFHILFRRFNQELPVILSEIPPEKIEPLVDVGNKGFRRRQGHSPFRQKLLYALLGPFQNVFRRPGQNPVIGITHEMEALSFRPCFKPEI